MGKTIIISSVGLAFCASVLIVVAFGKSRSEPLPELGSVSSFTLTANDGEAFSAEDLKGKVTIVDFFFTSCKGICPALTQQMESLQTRFEGYPELHLLSVTVDPENDTPQTLSDYAAENDLKLENWDLVTGPRSDIRNLLFDQLKIGLPDDPLTHSDRLVLIDTDLKIRGYYSLSHPESLQKLRRDAVRLLDK